MKKPYIKKISEVAHFTVWIVDGKYIRENINEEFTNYGQNYLFDFIPKNEFWIDKERKDGEEKYYIDSMLAMNHLMAKGLSHAQASKIATVIEKKERAKSELMKKEMKIRKDKEKLLNSLHKRLLKKYSTKNVKVWVVDGEAVRDLFFLDFTEGGHEFVYNFVPKGEVWIDDDVREDEIKFVLLHEMHERKLMEEGMIYVDAHASSSAIEYHCRKHLNDLDKNLNKEIKKNNHAEEFN
jgi:hypothetical protein